MLGGLVMPPAVFFTVIVIGAPVSAAKVPRDLAATIVGGAVIGAGFFLLGAVLGLVEAPAWMQTQEAQRQDGPM